VQINIRRRFTFFEIFPTHDRIKILHTLQELAVAPQECIAIEDSEKGIASAKEAGLDTNFFTNIT
jgi:HAD superfamily hydrolase (TIGR01509 family)